MRSHWSIRVLRVIFFVREDFKAIPPPPLVSMCFITQVLYLFVFKSTTFNRMNFKFDLGETIGEIIWMMRGKNGMDSK